MRRKNVGPPWRRHSGELVPNGGVFETTAREESMIAMPQYGLQAVLVPFSGAPPPAIAILLPVTPLPAVVAAISDKVKAAESEALQAQWPLKVAPESYLERYPDGKHADLARRLVAEAVEPKEGA